MIGLMVWVISNNKTPEHGLGSLRLNPRPLLAGALKFTAPAAAPG